MTDSHEETLDEFVSRHRRLAAKDEMRLGQRFCNEFVRGNWPALYYQGNEGLALKLIREYLADKQYYPYMPPPL